jgi:hypothetical protein
MLICGERCAGQCGEAGCGDDDECSESVGADVDMAGSFGQDL